MFYHNMASMHLGSLLFLFSQPFLLVEDDLKEREATRLADYIARLPPDPEGKPPVVDLPPLRRPPSGAPPK